MGVKLVNIGYGNFASASRLISIISPDSAPVKRIVQEARDSRTLIDATYGRRSAHRGQRTRHPVGRAAGDRRPPARRAGGDADGRGGKR